MNAPDDVFVGISIAGSELTTVEMRPQEEPPLITAMDRVSLASSIELSTLRDGGAKDALVAALQAVLRSEGKPTRAAVAINDRLAFIKCLPVDRGLGKDELAEHVRWEVEQLLVARGNEYVVDSSCVPVVDEAHDRLVLVAIRKPIIELLKQVAQEAGVRLAAVDLDLFAGLRAAVYNHQLVQANATGLLRLSPFGATLMVLRRGELYDMCEAPLPSGGESDPGTWDDTRARELWEELRRRSGNGQIDRLLVYGAPVPVAFVAKLRPQCAVPVNVIDPIKRLQLAPALGGTEAPFSGASLVAAIGAALRSVPRSRG
ncbi:MAG: pilus assembly protein PilM [candidate division KSB1 bacterium]|nr:pilus assembly protein PilM [candidate division KSB1 bacterium]MDZ7385225.1 pilus assembly protein PilM [candidate division KSB1 bacterium]MDZ7392329.1 pilus assembly protein PilM [candidate division KSB1 bacterium]